MSPLLNDLEVGKSYVEFVTFNLHLHSLFQNTEE